MKYLRYVLVGAGILLVIYLVVSLELSRETSRIPNNQNKETNPQNNFEIKTNDDSQVSVTAVPKNISNNADTLDFELTFNTHSVELSEDLIQVSTLIDGNGREYKPISWDGDGSGGHHRVGILRFRPISPLPESIELKISVGQTERSFKWNLK